MNTEGKRPLTATAEMGAMQPQAKDPKLPIDERGQEGFTPGTSRDSMACQSSEIRSALQNFEMIISII